MKKEKLRLVVGIISIVLVVLAVAGLFSSERFIDNLEGDNGPSRQVSSIIVSFSMIVALGAAIVNVLKRKSASRLLFIIIGSLYTIGFLFSFGFGTLSLFVTIHSLFSLLCAIFFIILAIIEKKPKN